jgi:hypothetical protein
MKSSVFADETAQQVRVAAAGGDLELEIPKNCLCSFSNGPPNN